MLQANPKLTPNLVKAIIEYTAQDMRYDPLTQGAGFLNAKGAVDLARFLKNPQAGQNYPHNTTWSRTFLWGNKKVKRGVIKPTGNAWAPSTVWGASSTGEVDNIVWGASSEADNITWGCAGEETPTFDDPDYPTVFDGTIDLDGAFGTQGDIPPDPTLQPDPPPAVVPNPLDVVPGTVVGGL